jgi:hypothetical protein
MTQDIKDSEIAEKVFLNEDYQLVDEKDAYAVRLRLKDGRTLYGLPSKKRPDAKVVLMTEKDFQCRSPKQM